MLFDLFVLVIKNFSCDIYRSVLRFNICSGKIFADHADAEKLETAKEKAFELGVSRGIDPFMTLSFMALPVIPSLRITTRGVFDVNSQSYV